MTGKGKPPQGTDDRTGTYGGDDGAMEHERTLTAPGEDTGTTGTPTAPREQGTTQAEQKEDKDLETGAENPG